MPISFMRQSVTRVRPGKKINGYGQEIDDWTESASSRKVIHRCSVQAIAGEETLDPQRDSILFRFRLLAPHNADIDSRDRIEFDGTTYLIDGPVERPISPTGRLSHVACLLKRSEG